MKKTFYHDIAGVITNELKKLAVLSKNIRVSYYYNGKMQIKTHLKANGDGSSTIVDVVNILSEVTKRKFDISNNNRVIINGKWNEYIFVEKGRFDAIWGVSTRNFLADQVSGDNYLVKKMDEGRIVLGIADGMGSGISANMDSEMILEKLDNDITKGFSAQNVLNAANRIMSTRKNIQTTVAVDLCVIDLFIGIAEFIKLGAVAAYIKRGNIIESIQSETLPIGVLVDVDYDSVRKKLYGGDYIIMVSDGVIEMMPELNKEKEFAKLICSVKSLNPSAMAHEIMDLVTNKKTICDDLTIMVVGIYE